MKIEQIRKRAIKKDEPYQRPKDPGIYLLLNNGEVVYVGQSIYCEERAREHASGLDEKQYDSFCIHRCSEHKLDLLEARYIIEFRPRYNKELPAGSPYKTTQSIKKLYNEHGGHPDTNREITGHDIRRVLNAQEDLGYELRPVHFSGYEYYHIVGFNELFKLYLERGGSNG